MALAGDESEEESEVRPILEEKNERNIRNYSMEVDTRMG